MSGIATLTRQFVQAVAGTNDYSRYSSKTARAFAAWINWPCSPGGGQNHRFGLYDMILDQG